ncbi:MAG: SAM-dependent methyltransferase [Candidatus Dormiibacterota bacterium]
MPAPHRPRGSQKLEAALAAFDLPAQDRIALDAGASTGGFTLALLEAGVRRVYAVDAGYGQLLGSLRIDPRVVNLERTNLGQLTPALVPDQLEVITLDLSYLAVAAAIPQLDGLRIAHDADLVALVKPTFELRLARPPADPATARQALEQAVTGVEAAGWRVVASIESPVRGSGGTIEFLLHARPAGGR